VCHDIITWFRNSEVNSGYTQTAWGSDKSTFLNNKKNKLIISVCGGNPSICICKHHEKDATVPYYIWPNVSHFVAFAYSN
jgi:hypothetical protein